MSGKHLGAGLLVNAQLRAVIEFGNYFYEVFWGLDGLVEQFAFHERYEQRAGTRLAIDRTMRIELDVRETGVSIEFFAPFPVWI